MKIDELTVFSRAFVAHLLGIPARTFADLVKREILPKPTGRKYDAAACVRAFLAYKIADRGPANAAFEKARLTREQADRAALQNAVRRGELLIAAEVHQVNLEIAADFAGRVDGIPGRVAGELAAITDPGEVRARLVIEMRALRSGFADAILKIAQRQAPNE